MVARAAWSHKAVLAVAAVCLIASVTLTSDLSNASETQYGSIYTPSDVQSAADFAKLVNETAVVVTPPITYDLLVYGGVSPSQIVSNSSMLSSLQSSVNVSSFYSEIRAHFPNATSFEYFRLTLLQDPFPNFTKWARILGEVNEIGDASVGVISLRYSALTQKQLPNSSVRAYFPAGPQWVYYNLTGVSMSKVLDIALTIDLGTSPKNIMTILSYTNGTVSKRVDLSLQSGEHQYYLTSTELGISADSSLSEIAFSFSWFDSSAVNATIVSIDKLGY